MSDTILLLESDEQVIKDISCSLRLIDISVVSALSVTEAVQIVQERSPSIIISRSQVQGAASVASGLLNALAEAADKTPVYLLCTASEKAAMDGAQGFAGEIMLPVEFPAFAEEVRGILGKSERVVPGGEISPAAVSLAKVKRHNIPEVAQQQSSDDEIDEVAVKDRNFALAYSIQSKVLRELELDGRLQRASEEQVPGIVNQVTAKVCVRLASEKFL